MYNLVNIISITKINAKLYNVSVSLTVALKFGLASPLGSQVQTETGYAFIMYIYMYICIYMHKYMLCIYATMR